MNGQDPTAAIFGLFSCMLLLVPILFALGMLAFFIYTIVHAATHRMENQAVWVLVVVLGGPIGGLAYFIAKPYRQG